MTFRLPFADEDVLCEGTELAKPLSTLPASLWPEGDLFDHFPKAIRPKKPCLVMGGEGARSSLHVDPYSWTGWNYLLEGSKIWTFFPPGPCAEALFKATRIQSSSWDLGKFNISAGWQSPVDIYEQKKGSKTWPSAMDLGMEMSEVGGSFLTAYQVAS